MCVELESKNLADISWLVHSIKPNVTHIFKYYKMAKEIWNSNRLLKHIHKRYFLPGYMSCVGKSCSFDKVTNTLMIIKRQHMEFCLSCININAFTLACAQRTMGSDLSDLSMYTRFFICSVESLLSFWACLLLAPSVWILFVLLIFIYFGYISIGNAARILVERTVHWRRKIVT